jgi:hypothetical protein
LSKKKEEEDVEIPATTRDQMSLVRLMKKPEKSQGLAE